MLQSTQVFSGILYICNIMPLMPGGSTKAELLLITTTIEMRIEKESLRRSIGTSNGGFGKSGCDVFAHSGHDFVRS